MEGSKPDSQHSVGVGGTVVRLTEALAGQRSETKHQPMGLICREGNQSAEHKGESVDGYQTFVGDMLVQSQ
eukprot:scaffold109885_cov61-Cyclotella_meneghiniana.AAC.1